MSKSLSANTIPTTLVVFGATGDLMARKILPSLFSLFERKELPVSFSVIGISRKELTDRAFRLHVTRALVDHAGVFDRRRIAPFVKRISYQKGLFDDEQTYRTLAVRLGMANGIWQTCLSRLFYLAVPPRLYESIFHHLYTSSLMKPCRPVEGYTRILVEKPFGTNMEHAEKLDRLLGELFEEDQIYRIDHYLAKEALQNILAFRFSNNLLERVWDRASVSSIHIKLLETIDVEGRGSFYDNVGALLDVGQNHILQMLALVTMEHPGRFTPQAIRSSRAVALEQLAPLTPRKVRQKTARAQYRGYRREIGVRPNSKTETYFQVESVLNSSRWRGVPIILEGGKAMPDLKKEIVVIFRHPRPCLCPSGADHYTNTVHFRIQPDPGITIRFWAKKPGSKMDLEEQRLEFRSSNNGSGRRYLDEYARLLRDALYGDPTLFATSRETMAGWRFIDPIVRTWKKNAPPLRLYGTVHGTSKKQVRSVGFVGLGKMGENMAVRLLERSWLVVGYDPSWEARQALAWHPNFHGTSALPELINSLKTPRVLWVMVPHDAVDKVLFGKEGVISFLKQGDMIIDGSNSYYRDSIRRARRLGSKGIQFVDVGVSGGPVGARHGAALMVGGRRQTFKKLEPLFRDLAIQDGLQFFEGYGAGHFVKMVHNGVEYGMMQAIAEGFTILKKAKYQLDVTKAADIYNHGSVIESRLMNWLKEAFDLYGEDLKGVSGSVGHTGEGAWTVQTAKAEKIKAHVIEEALKFRIRSKTKPDYTGKILSALRAQFGGHSMQ